METRNKAILIILIVILSMSGVFVSIALYEFKENYNERLVQHERALGYLVEAEFSQMSRAYVSRINGFIKANKSLMAAFKNRERENVVQLLTPRFNTLLKENSDFYNISFYLPDGRLFLSMADITAYGKDMSAHPSIKALKGETEVLHGFVIHNDKLFFQVAQKIIINGKSEGMLEFMIHTNIMHDIIKEVLGAEYGLIIANPDQPEHISIHGASTIIDKSCSIYDNLPPEFLPGKNMQKITIGEEDYIIHSKNIYNFKGDLIAYYLTSNDITDIRERYTAFFIYILIITGVVIILSSSVLYMGFGAVLRKVELLNINLETKVKERTKELEESKNNALEQNRVISSLYKRFKSMFQDHHSVMFLIDPKDGHIVDANNAALAFMNLKKSDINEMTVCNFSLLPDEEVLNILDRAMHKGLKNYISRFRFPDGSFDFEIQAAPIEIDGKGVLFAICHDVTEKTKIEQELKDLNKNLEKRIEEEADNKRKQEMLLMQQSKMSSVGEILSAIIHQWKQPITAISYIMQDLADAAERNNADQEYLISTSDEALSLINYMNQTVEDFRSFLMPSKEKISFNVVDEIVSVLSMLGKQISKDDISLRLTVVNMTSDSTGLELDDILSGDKIDIPTTCFSSFGYPNEFKQVLMNIINNARDAIKGKVTEGQINILVAFQTENIEITIADNAGGIPAGILEKVFEPYFTTKSTKGTGIGLYMAKNIIENHMNGSVTAANQGKGAIFTITLKSDLS